MLRQWLKRRREAREARIVEALTRNLELAGFDLSQTTGLRGGIYPYLARMEQDERIISYIRIVGSRPRRFYRLNPNGTAEHWLDAFHARAGRS